MRKSKVARSLDSLENRLYTAEENQYKTHRPAGIRAEKAATLHQVLATAADVFKQLVF